MEKETNTALEGDVFEDLLKENKLTPVSFQDQQLENFDAASALKEAAQNLPDTQTKPRFGKRADRKKNPAVNPETLSFAPAASMEAKTAPAKSEPSKPASFSPAAAQLKKQNTPSELEQATFVKPVASQAILPAAQPEKEAEKQAELEERLFARFEEEEPKEAKAEVREDLIDPSASLVDDYDYDLYEDKKHFLLSDFSRTEEYLGKQSKQGYHYVRHEGKKYYFHHGFPRDYYYEILYFADEPTQEDWDAWEADGWSLICRTPAKKKSEAGWFVLRNEYKDGAFRKEIANEEEKYRFFRSYSNSCRSTMFLLFICMVVCVIMGILQYFFKGYPLYILFTVFLFAITLWVFLVYGRMLRKSNKQIRLLKAKIRLADAAAAEEPEPTLDEKEQELEEDWDKATKEIETRRQEKLSRRKRRG